MTALLCLSRLQLPTPRTSAAARATSTAATEATAAAVVAARLAELLLHTAVCIQGLAYLVLIPGVVAAQQCWQRCGALKLLYWPIGPDEVKASLVCWVGARLPLALQVNDVKHVLSSTRHTHMHRINYRLLTQLLLVTLCGTPCSTQLVLTASWDMLKLVIRRAHTTQRTGHMRKHTSMLHCGV